MNALVIDATSHTMDRYCYKILDVNYFSNLKCCTCSGILKSFKETP